MKFEPGEIAICIYPDEDYNTEVTITAGEIATGKFSKKCSNKIRTNSCPGYEVIFSDGREGFLGTKHLRKKKPPRENKDITETQKNPNNKSWEQFKDEIRKVMTCN